MHQAASGVDFAPVLASTPQAKAKNAKAPGTIIGFKARLHKKMWGALARRCIPDKGTTHDA